MMAYLVWRKTFSGVMIRDKIPSREGYFLHTAYERLYSPDVTPMTPRGILPPDTGTSFAYWIAATEFKETQRGIKLYAGHGQIV